MKLAARISLIKPSPTLTIQAKANALKAAGRDIIGFGAGEPDFDTPRNIKDAAIRAIEAGFTKYTPVGGTDELKDAVIAKLQRDNQLAYKRSEVVKTNIEDGFKLQPSQLEAAITPRTRAIIISYPSNPAGVSYSREELEALAEVIIRRGIMVISDAIYEKIIYAHASPFPPMASLSEELKRITIVVNGVSKTYAMTGWRIGYAAGNEETIAAMTKYQSQNTSNPTSIAQKAAVEALNGSQESLPMMGGEFKTRRDV